MSILKVGLLINQTSEVALNKFQGILYGTFVMILGSNRRFKLSTY